MRALERWCEQFRTMYKTTSIPEAKQMGIFAKLQNLTRKEIFKVLPARSFIAIDKSPCRHLQRPLVPCVSAAAESAPPSPPSSSARPHGAPGAPAAVSPTRPSSVGALPAPGIPGKPWDSRTDGGRSRGNASISGTLRQDA